MDPCCCSLTAGDSQPLASHSQGGAKAMASTLRLGLATLLLLGQEWRAPPNLVAVRPDHPPLPSSPQHRAGAVAAWGGTSEPPEPPGATGRSLKASGSHTKGACSLLPGLTFQRPSTGTGPSAQEKRTWEGADACSHRPASHGELEGCLCLLWVTGAHHHRLCDTGSLTRGPKPGPRPGRVASTPS